MPPDREPPEVPAGVAGPEPVAEPAAEIGADGAEDAGQQADHDAGLGPGEVVDPRQEHEVEGDLGTDRERVERGPDQDLPHRRSAQEEAEHLAERLDAGVRMAVESAAHGLAQGRAGEEREREPRGTEQEEDRAPVEPIGERAADDRAEEIDRDAELVGREGRWAGDAVEISEWAAGAPASPC
jgi:hypothetical protein